MEEEGGGEELTASSSEEGREEAKRVERQKWGLFDVSSPPSSTLCLRWWKEGRVQPLPLSRLGFHGRYIQLSSVGGEGGGRILLPFSRPFSPFCGVATKCCSFRHFVSPNLRKSPAFLLLLLTLDDGCREISEVCVGSGEGEGKNTYLE